MPAAKCMHCWFSCHACWHSWVLLAVFSPAEWFLKTNHRVVHRSISNNGHNVQLTHVETQYLKIFTYARLLWESSTILKLARVRCTTCERILKRAAFISTKLASDRSTRSFVSPRGWRRLQDALDWVVYHNSVPGHIDGWVLRWFTVYISHIVGKSQEYLHFKQSEAKHTHACNAKLKKHWVWH